jgi:hypothetical protein
LLVAQPAVASEPAPVPLATRAWLWPNLLSLDAPIVALLWQALFLRCFHATFDRLAAGLLVLSVWLIYAADRWLDVWKKPVKDRIRYPISNRTPLVDHEGERETERETIVLDQVFIEAAREPARHRFYRRHWRRMLPVWIAVFTMAAWLAWTKLPAVLFERGLALLAAIGVYFAFVHFAPWRWWPKEFAVGILFAMGTSLAAWGHVRSPVDVATIVLFCMLCWINCAAIEHWEQGKRHWSAEWPVRLAAIAVGLVALIFLYNQRPILSGAETASAFAFVALDRAKHRFSPDALRVLADIALLTPILFLPIAGLRA